MTHELPSEYSPLKDLPELWMITRVETKGGKRILVPTEIHKDRGGPDSEYSEFVVREIGRLDDRINLIKAGAPPFKGHGVRRGKSDARQMRERWGGREAIPNYIHVINALSGKVDVTVEFFRSKGKLYNYNLKLRNGSAPNP